MLALILLGVFATSTAPAAASFEGVRADVLAATPEPRSTSIGVYRPGTTEFYGKSGQAGIQDDQDSGFQFAYGTASDVPVIGDWDGNGTQTQGVYRAGTWILANTLGSETGDYERVYGQAGDQPIVGDWDGDGIETIGFRRGSEFFLSNSNLFPSTAYQFTIDQAGGIPVAGDWDGDGVDSVGVYRSGTWSLRNSNSGGAPDTTVTFGSDTDLPVVGDWDSDGRVSIGYVRQGAWYLSNTIAAPGVDTHAYWGNATDRPLVGNWGATAQVSADTPSSLSGFFPIAVDYQPASRFSTWKRRGVNTVIRVPPNESIETWTSTANALGLRMIRAPRADPALDDAEPNLLAFTGPDEPEITGHSPDTIEAEYLRLKQSAPSKPYLINLAGASVLFQAPPADGISCNGAGVTSGDEACLGRYIGATDWVSHDIYPVNTRQSIGTIGLSLDRLRQWSGPRPQFAYIEASDLWNDGVVPTSDQFRGEIWHAIIHGARGISYFVVDVADPVQRPDAIPENLVAEMQAQNDRITRLASVLQTPINPPAVGMTAPPPLEYTWRQSGSKTYLIVLNQSGETVDNAAIQVFGAAVPPTITVWDENRTLPTSANSFGDSFGPYAVHIYEF
jgi:hypothetical protein